MAEIIEGSFGPPPKERKQNGNLRPKLLLFGALAVCTVLVILILFSGWKYKSFRVRFTDANEYVLAYKYYSFRDNVLKVASDSAVYINEKNETFWTVSYDMTNPDAVFAGDYAVIFDRNGTDIVLCSSAGNAVRIKTTSPIYRAAAGENGSVAAITDDGTDAMVEYYDSAGNKVSSIKTTMESTGYPFDAALSGDGTILAVAFVTFEDSQMTSRVRFYNFTQKGSEHEDNIISTYAYTGVLMPMIECLDSDTFVGFSTDGVYLYNGKETPSQTKMIESEGNIISAFTGKNYFGFISNSEATGENTITLFSSGGRKKGSAVVGIAYTAMSIGDKEVLLYNRNQMEVYGLNGTRRYHDDTDELVRQIEVIGNNRYVMISEEEYKLISLT